MEMLQKFLCVFSFVVIVNAQTHCSDDIYSGLAFRRVGNQIGWKLLHTPSHEVQLWVKELEQRAQNTSDGFERTMIGATVVRVLALKNANVEYERQKFDESLEHN